VEYEKSDFLQSFLNDKEASLIAEFMVKSISIPEMSFDVKENVRGGRAYKESGSVKTGDSKISSYNDVQSMVYSFWIDWYNLVVDSSSKSNYRRFPSEYKMNVIVRKLTRSVTGADEEGRVRDDQYDFVYKLRLLGCFPTNVSTSDLSWDSEGLPTVDVNLSVDRVEILSFPQPIGSVRSEKKIRGTRGLSTKRIFEAKKGEFSLRERIERAGKLVGKQVLKRFENQILDRVPQQVRRFDYKEFLTGNRIGVLKDFVERELTDWVTGKLAFDLPDYLVKKLSGELKESVKKFEAQYLNSMIEPTMKFEVDLSEKVVPDIDFKITKTLTADQLIKIQEERNQKVKNDFLLRIK